MCLFDDALVVVLVFSWWFGREFGVCLLFSYLFGDLVVVLVFVWRVSRGRDCLLLVSVFTRWFASGHALIHTSNQSGLQLPRRYHIPRGILF